MKTLALLLLAVALSACAASPTESLSLAEQRARFCVDSSLINVSLLAPLDPCH